MTWTTQRPTVPGWYWTRAGRRGSRRIVRVDIPDGIVTYVGSYGARTAAHPGDGREWQGPIPEPEEREEA